MMFNFHKTQKHFLFFVFAEKLFGAFAVRSSSHYFSAKNIPTSDIVSTVRVNECSANDFVKLVITLNN